MAKRSSFRRDPSQNLTRVSPGIYRNQQGELSGPGGSKLPPQVGQNIGQILSSGLAGVPSSSQVGNRVPQQSKGGGVRPQQQAQVNQSINRPLRPNESMATIQAQLQSGFGGQPSNKMSQLPFQGQSSAQGYNNPYDQYMQRNIQAQPPMQQGGNWLGSPPPSNFRNSADFMNWQARGFPSQPQSQEEADAMRANVPQSQVQDMQNQAMQQGANQAMQQYQGQYNPYLKRN